MRSVSRTRAQHRVGRRQNVLVATPGGGEVCGAPNERACRRRRGSPARPWSQPSRRERAGAAGAVAPVRPSTGATAQRGRGRSTLFPPRRPPSTSFAALAAVRGPGRHPSSPPSTLVGRCRRRAAVDAVPASGAVGRVHEGTRWPRVLDGERRRRAPGVDLVTIVGVPTRRS